MQPTRRDLHFKVPADRVFDWHAGGAHITEFYNTLSLTFPRGERFFIDSVRNYRDRITDPELQEQVKAFIGQEAMHSREHQEYNDTLEAAGLPAHKVDRRVTKLLDHIRDTRSHAEQLSATIALEHFTAMLANVLLSHPEEFDGAQADFARMWQWHALEETEHKAVAFDVYREVMGRGPRAYLERAVGMLITTAIFWSMTFSFHIQMVNAAPNAKKEGHVRGYARMLKFLFRKPGVITSCIRPWLAYFRPGFHPWQHDNSHYLKQIDELVAEADQAYAKAS